MLEENGLKRLATLNEAQMADPMQKINHVFNSMRRYLTINLTSESLSVDCERLKKKRVFPICPVWKKIRLDLTKNDIILNF